MIEDKRAGAVERTDQSTRAATHAFELQSQRGLSRQRRSAIAEQQLRRIGIRHHYPPLQIERVGCAADRDLARQLSAEQFASDVLHVGSGGLGLLTACSGAGAVCGALFVASRDETTQPYRLMLTGLVAFGLTLIGFAVSPWVWLSAPRSTRSRL